MKYSDNRNTEENAKNEIARLNDQLRAFGLGGDILITQTIQNLSDVTRRKLIKAIQDFDQFDLSNDPYNEHDFGSVELMDETYFFKIDYYNKTLDGGSEDPSNDKITKRVMTILHSREY